MEKWNVIFTLKSHEGEYNIPSFFSMLDLGQSERSELFKHKMNHTIIRAKNSLNWQLALDCQYQITDS